MVRGNLKRLVRFLILRILEKGIGNSKVLRCKNPQAGPSLHEGGLQKRMLLIEHGRDS